MLLIIQDISYGVEGCNKHERTAPQTTRRERTKQFTIYRVVVKGAGVVQNTTCQHLQGDPEKAPTRFCIYLVPTTEENINQQSHIRSYSNTS